jgi:hypothetical protein
MWILFLLATFASVIAFNTKHQRLALLIITFLATSAFQLLSVRWFSSPVVLSKPYDYAYLAMLMIFLLNINKVMKSITSERVAMVAAVYLAFILVVLIASITWYSYSPVQAFQSARVFAWPLFLLLFMITDRMALERFVKSLGPIVIVTSILYLLQPVLGKNIINPDSYYFNPYLGATEFKRYLSTPDFLILFLMLFYYQICTGKEKALGVILGRWLGLALLIAVQITSLTRSAIVATGVALLYISKRILNSVMVALFIASVAVAVAVAYSTSSVVESRVDDSWKDITSSMAGDYLSWRPGTDGNFSYRLAHLNERLTYVFADAKRWPFGLGFIHEDSAVAQNLGFKIGLKNPLTGRVVQVDTGDIAWSVVVTKTGFIGLALMLWFLAGSSLSVGSKTDKYAVIYRGGLLYYLFTSFFSINFTNPSYMLPLMLFLTLAINERNMTDAQPTKKKINISYG